MYLLLVMNARRHDSARVGHDLEGVVRGPARALGAHHSPTTRRRFRGRRRCVARSAPT